MEPAIAAGTHVLVDPDWDDLRAGDVVCFLDGEDGSWTMHRVLARLRVFGRDYVVQAPEKGSEATVVPHDRVVGRVRGLGGDFHRPLTVFERLLAVDAVAWSVGSKLRHRIPGLRSLPSGLGASRRAILDALRRRLRP